MLQKIKHILPLLLAALFLYPMVFQSVHVFEHDQETNCCGSCSHAQDAAPVSESDDAQPYYTQHEDQCPICDFHFAKLQVNSTLVFTSLIDSHELPELQNYPKPFVLFQGYIFSLRAPPIG